MDIDLFEHKLQIATADDVNTNGSFGEAVDVDGNYAIVTKKGHQENFNSAYIFKKTGTNWAMHQDISGQPIGYDNFGLDAKIRNELVFVSCRTYYSDSSQRASNEKGGIHVYKLNNTSGNFESFNPANLDPTDKSKYGYDNAGNYDDNWGPFNFPAGPDARANVIVPGPNYDGTTPENFYFDAIPENPNAEFSYFFDVFYENNVYTLIVGHPGTNEFYIFRHDTTDSSKGWLRWKYNPSTAGTQKTGYDDVAIYGDYVFLGYTEEDSKKGKVIIYKFDNTQVNFADKWQKQTTDLVPVTRSDDERFGTSLSAMEDYLVVGTENERALIYNKDANGDWLNTTEKILTPITAESNSKFGIEVAIGKLYGEFYAIIGARQKTVNSQTNEGAFYLYKLVDGSWIQRDDDTDGEFVQASGDNPSATFSASINIRNNQIIVGAGGHQNNTTADNSATTYTGAAYIFNLTDNTPTTLNLGLNDISDNFLVKTSLVNIAGVDDYFKDTINIKNFTENELTTLFTDLSNNINTKSVKNHIAFKLIKIKPSIAETVLNKLYVSNDTANGTFDINDIIHVAKKTIFDPSNNENIESGTLFPDSISKSIFKGLKTISLKKNKEDLNKSTLEQTIKNISTTDNDDNIEEYLTNIELDLSLNLAGANLSNVDLSNVDLSGAILTDVDLTGTNLSSANLIGADLSGAILENSNLSETKLTNVQNVKYSSGIASSYPYQLQEYNGQMRSLTEELSNASISTMETKIGPFKQGQTIIVNGTKIILGASVSDAEIINSNPNSDGDSFTFIEKDNKIKNWGHKNKGGNIPTDISNVKIISSNENSTAILTTNGYVYAWGNDNFGGNITQDLSGITELFANEKAYCALKNDGKIFCWGDNSTGGTTPSNIENVIKVYSNKNAFTALLSNGTIHSWGSVNGDVPTTNNYIDIFSTQDCFCGLKGDGTIESWGSSNNSLNTTPNDISNVSMVFSNDNAFVALTSNGYLYNWGDSSYGGTTNLSTLDNIEKVFNNNHAFACLDENNNLFCWGDSNKGGTTPDVSKNIINIFSTQDAFTGIKTDKSIVCWGNANNGGTAPTESTTVNDVATILFAYYGAAVLKTDKTIVTWGWGDSDHYIGYEEEAEFYFFNMAVQKKIHNLRNVKQIYTNGMAMAALMEDGTVTVWGNPYSINNSNGSDDDFTYIDELKDIVDIYPVFHGFIYVDKNNKVFSMGANYLTSTPPMNGEKIIKIGTSYYCSGILTESGTLKEWGHSSYTYDTEITNVKNWFTQNTTSAVIKNDNSAIIWGHNGYTDERYLDDSTKGVRGPNSSTVDATLLNSDISNVYLNAESACAIKLDGSVIAWGRDTQGGNFHHSTYGARGGNSDSVDPSLLNSGVVKIIVRNDSYRGFIALKNDKSLVCWGDSYNNPHHTSYGIRKPTFYNDTAIYPEEINSNIEKVFVIRYSSCALKTDGSVISWGHNSHGGNICHSSYGVRSHYSSTVDPSILSSGVIAIYSNRSCFLAIKEGNVPYTWGDAVSGGNIHHSTYGVRSLNSDSIDPSILSDGIVKIVSGHHTWGVLFENGNIACWGHYDWGGNIHHNTYGIAASGGDIDKMRSVGVKDLFLGRTGMIAILNDNTAVAWGGQVSHYYPEYGFHNTHNINHILYNIDYNSKVFKNPIKTENESDYQYTHDNKYHYGVIYDVEDVSNNSVKTITSKLNNIEKVYSTDKAFSAINTNGELKIWGKTNYGGSYDYLTDKKRVVDVMSTKGAFIGINQDGTHFIWGNNNFGGFGGPTESFKFENRLQDLYSYCQSYRKSNLFAIYGINKDTRKFVEESFTDTNSAHIALSNDGTVSTWGNETFGASSANTQTTIDNLTNVKDIATGNDTVVALKSDGTLTAWNDDDITLADNSNFKKVVTGISGNIIGLKADGTVKYYNPDLGNWTLESNIDTSHITDLSGITDVFAFDKSFAALDDKGALTVWGDKGQGPGLIQTKVLEPDDISEGDRFGVDVAIDGDYIVVGAITADADDGDNGGVAYVFKKDEGGINNWGQIKKLQSDDADDHDQFGYRVEINGDYIFVTTLSDDDAADGAGAIFIFKKDEGGTDNWGQLKKITTSDAQQNDFLGRAVQVYGDYVVVGASLYNSTDNLSGGAYIFNKDEGGTDNWGEVKRFTAKYSLQYGGYNLGLYGDYMAMGSNSGVYVFEKDYDPLTPNDISSNAWGEVKHIQRGTLLGSYWGSRTNMYGDYIVIGAQAATIDNKTGAGCVYIFKKDYDPDTPNDISANAWGLIKTLTADEPIAEARFGQYVTIRSNNIYVYSKKSNDTEDAIGSIYIFKKNVENWEQIQIIKLTNGTINSGFGNKLDIKDGTNKLVTGEPYVNTNKGRAYLYEYDAGDGPNLLTNISSKASQLTSGVKSVTANSNVLIALKYDGTVVTLGNANNGGDISNTADQYKLYGGTADDIEEVFLNDKFAVALKRDRTCIYWGDISRNTDLFNSDISKFKNIKTIAYSKDVMVGLTFDSKIVTLGEKSKGADYPHKLEKNVEKVISASLNGFLAVTNDDKIYSWGEDSNYVKNIENTANNIVATSSNSTSSTTSSSGGTTSGGTTSGGTTSGGTTSGGTTSGGTTSGNNSSGGGYSY